MTDRMGDKIKVLIVDDSEFMQGAIQSVIESQASMEVVGVAGDGEEGLRKTLALKPDVITMDLEMPNMGGLESVERIMTEIPTPIVVVSSVDVNVIMKALDIGAMDFVPLTSNLEEIADDLVQKVKIASRVRALRRMRPRRNHAVAKAPSAKRGNHRVVAVGISTGGPQALRLFLSEIPADFPASILIVQHMSTGFIDGMATWLSNYSPLNVRLAEHGDVPGESTVLIAPDEHHMEIDNEGKIRLTKNGTIPTPHIPSIDVMLKSVAEAYGEHAVGVIMTGMGRDGVEGIRAIKKSGGITIAQDEESSVVFGMNRAAIVTGAVDKVVPLDKMSGEIIKIVQKERK